MSRAAAVAAIVAGACVAAYPFVARADDPKSHEGQHDTTHPGTPSQQGAQQGAQPGAAETQQGAATQPVVGARLITTEASIKKVDAARGTITLRGPQGNHFEVKAGPDVDLKRLHTGERVRISYYQEVAVAIDPATQPAARMSEQTVVRGGVAERQATATARIVSVDRKKNTVVVATPDGNKHSLEISDPTLQSKLSRIKPGQHFDITYTEALAMTVEPRSTARKQPAK